MNVSVPFMLWFISAHGFGFNADFSRLNLWEGGGLENLGGRIFFDHRYSISIWI
jgi:hypothetical protein